MFLRGNNFQYCEFSELLGKVLTSCKKKNDVDRFGESIRFITNEGVEYVMYHEQDCCESVHIDDICGKLKDLVGSEIIEAEEVSGETAIPEDFNEKDYNFEESYTWTFYKLRTKKGCVTIRWFGESNGYYSERVDFVKLK